MTNPEKEEIISKKYQWGVNGFIELTVFGCWLVEVDNKWWEPNHSSERLIKLRQTGKWNKRLLVRKFEYPRWILPLVRWNQLNSILAKLNFVERYPVGWEILTIKEMKYSLELKWIVLLNVRRIREILTDVTNGIEHIQFEFELIKNIRFVR